MQKTIFPGLVVFLGCHTCYGGKRKCPQLFTKPRPDPPFAPEVEENNLLPWQEQYYSDLGLTGQTNNKKFLTHRSPENSQSKRRRLNEEDGQPLTPLPVSKDGNENSQSGNSPQCTFDIPPPSPRRSSRVRAQLAAPGRSSQRNVKPNCIPVGSHQKPTVRKPSKHEKRDKETSETRIQEFDKPPPRYCTHGHFVSSSIPSNQHPPRPDCNSSLTTLGAPSPFGDFGSLDPHMESPLSGPFAAPGQCAQIRDKDNAKQNCSPTGSISSPHLVQTMGHDRPSSPLKQSSSGQMPPEQSGYTDPSASRAVSVNVRHEQHRALLNETPNYSRLIATDTAVKLNKDSKNGNVRPGRAEYQKEYYRKLKSNPDYMGNKRKAAAEYREKQKEKFKNAEAAFAIVTKEGMTIEEVKKEVKNAINSRLCDTEKKRFIGLLKDHADISEIALKAFADFKEKRKEHGAQERERQKEKFPNAEAAFKIVTEQGMKKEDRKKEVKNAIKYLPNDIQRQKFIDLLSENKDHAPILQLALTTNPDHKENKRKYDAEYAKKQKKKFANAEAAIVIATKGGMKKEDRKKEVKCAIKYLPNDIQRQKFIGLLSENKDYAHISELASKAFSVLVEKRRKYVADHREKKKNKNAEAAFEVV